MKFCGDYHTHTIYSHGKGDILENARVAQRRGLKQIAITDHGFGHLLYGVSAKKIKEIKTKIRFAEKQTGVKILLGIEANLISLKGDIDLTSEQIKQFDVLIVGYHRIVKSKLKDKFKFLLPNLFKKKRNSKKQIERNTTALLLAMDKYPIDIISHLNFEMTVDVERVAEKAIETNTLIELNSKRVHLTDDQLKKMAEMGVKFIVNSDAHTAEKVGDFNLMIEQIERCGINKEQIVNFKNLPKFKEK